MTLGTYKKYSILVENVDTGKQHVLYVITRNMQAVLQGLISDGLAVVDYRKMQYEPAIQ